MMTLTALLKNIVSVPTEFDCVVTGLAMDSRLVKPGNLFFAISGEHVDGIKFLEAAREQGACAVLTDSQTSHSCTSIPVIYVSDLAQKMGDIAAKFFDFPSRKMKMLGVTGTNGKTSCSHFIASVLQQMQMPCGVIGTLGNGLYGNLQPSLFTTPQPIALQSALADIFSQGAKAVAMEVSSHSLEQGRVNGIEFAVGIFTNLTRDHLDYHGSMEAYAAAKAKLFSKSRTQIAVINADDEFGLQLLKNADNQEVFAYSINKEIVLPVSVPLITVDKVELDISGIRAHVLTPWGEGELSAALIGKFNLSNLLAVLTALCALKIPLQAVLKCMAQIKSVPGRMQPLGGQDKPLVIVDYAHTPDALEKVLVGLRKHCQGKLYCLFGCGGDRDRGKRPLMAKAAEQFSDYVFVTDDNPRTEDAKQIVADLLKGFVYPEKVVVQHDRAKAIAEVILSAKVGDCVLIAGKGAEEYQQIGVEKIPFSDIKVVGQVMGIRVTEKQ